MKNKKRLFTLLTFAIIIILIILRLIANKQSLEAEQKLATEFNQKVPVTIDTVKNKTISTEFIVQGSFTPMHELTVISETQGKVTSIMVETGISVKENQILATTDNEVFISQFELAKANYEKAQKDLKRFEKLSLNDAVSIQQYESAKLNLANAQSAYITARKQYENSTIKAPVSGIIGKRYIERGTYLNPGAPVFDLIEVNKVKFQAKLTSDELPIVILGQNVNVSVDNYPNELYQGKVHSINIQTDPSKRYAVDIEVDNHTDKVIKPGMYGKVLFEGEKVSSLVIPRESIAGSIITPEVFIVKGDSVISKSISVKLLNGKYLVIKDGLNEGDIIVTSGQINLLNGTKIRVVK
jgi:membrane fusion protein, multidrug efflux system